MVGVKRMEQRLIFNPIILAIVWLLEELEVARTRDFRVYLYSFVACNSLASFSLNDAPPWWHYSSIS